MNPSMYPYCYIKNLQSYGSRTNHPIDHIPSGDLRPRHHSWE